MRLVSLEWDREAGLVHESWMSENTHQRGPYGEMPPGDEERKKKSTAFSQEKASCKAVLAGEVPQNTLQGRAVKACETKEDQQGNEDCGQEGDE